MKHLTIKIIAIAFLLIACEEKKVEFVQSKVMPYVFLIKYSPNQDFLLKNEITNFLIKNPSEYKKKPFQLIFYKYTSNTEYFIENYPIPEGFLVKN